ncbi:unnamed protein product [Lota lota]
MSFPQLGFTQFLSAPHELYAGERPGSAREGGADSGVSPSATAAAVSSMLGMYGNPWAHNYSAFLPYGGATDLALISQMGPQFDLKESPGARSAALPVHATQGFYPYGQYPYGDPSRAKNATRETTSTLKAWLLEHQKNPYPTKGEKIMLAIITRMTLTQVSTWFANARRRLKKENKVTWSPRACKSSEDRGCDEDSDGGEEQIKSEKEPCDQRMGELQSDLEDFDRLESDGSESEPKTQFVPEDSGSKTPLAELSHSRQPIASDSDTMRGKDSIPSDCQKLTAAQHQSSTFYPLVDLPASSEATLKVWSIAHQAASLQPEYSPCMLAYPSSPGYPASAELTTTAATPSRRHDSPVVTLRDWVDGIFHDGLFQQRAPNQALAESEVTAVWEGLSDVQMDSRAAGRSY